MFAVSSERCAVLKAVADLVKADHTSVSASKKNQMITFTMFNSNTNVLFYHQTQADVDDPQKLAVATDRLTALLCGKGEDKIGMNFNGSALEYKYRKNKGKVETHNYEAHERPNLQADKTLTNLVRKHVGLLALKVVVENTEVFMFIEEKPTYTQICVSDSGGFHAVVLKIDNKNTTSNQIAVPLAYVQGAIKTLKENIQMCNDEDSLYCYTKEKGTATILRFRNILDTQGITADILVDAVNRENDFLFTGPSTLFDDILKGYKVIADPDRGGMIKVVMDGGRITLSCETRHGTEESSPDIRTKTEGRYEFLLPTSILPDIMRLKGDVRYSVKKDANIFSINQVNRDTGIDATFFCTCERISSPQ